MSEPDVSMEGATASVPHGTGQDLPGADLPGGGEATGTWSLRFLRSIVENIPLMVFVKEADELRFILFNKAGEDLTGVDALKIVGQSDYDLFSAEDAERFTSKDREVLASGRLCDIPREVLPTPSGDRILHTRKIPLLDPDGTPRFLLGISEDITDQVAAETELRRAREASEAASVAKSEFLSRVSHELRTPLNAILGFAQLLELDDPDPKHREFIAHIEDAGKHLLNLINDVLDLSGMQSRGMSLSLEPVEVCDAMGAAVNLVRPLAEQHGVELPVSMNGDKDCAVQADGQRLRQIFINLLSNAIKYNRPGGKVTVACGATQSTVRISVSDEGNGIDPVRLSRIFDAFERVGAETSDIEGTGLGLAVSRQLAQMMDGDIEVRSVVGEGSTFTLELPSAQSPTTTARLINKQAPNLVDGAVKIVYVEDNPANIALLKMIMSYVPQAELIVAEDGESGLRRIRSERPDLVFLDVHLPTMQGEEVLRRLMDDPETKDIPVVMVSADATPQRIAELKSAGASDFIAKPFQIDSIFEAVAHFARASKA